MKWTPPKEFIYRGKWVANWFSNFVMSPIEIDGLIQPSVEHYYQAQKNLNPNYQEAVRCAVTLAKAKAYGRHCELREDWEQVRETVMLTALRAKFSLPEWKEKLLATGDEVLIEWNNWRDKYWGVTVDDLQGENRLGYLLMQVREDLKNQ